MTTKKLTTMAMFAALSVLLVWLVHFPIFPAAPYLEYDPADIPILVGTFAFGPLAGLVLTIIASVIQGITVSAGSGVYGILMHIVATGAYVLVAGNVYRRKKTRANAAFALVLGTLAMTIVMAGANLIITPLFTGMPVEAITGMLFPVILPFNLIKAGLNGAVTFMVYKTVSSLLKTDVACKKLKTEQTR
ncbi:MAG: ECF transporter S component [Christensenellales bacterium]|jgi:riboflavin transporter FmnP